MANPETSKKKKSSLNKRKMEKQPEKDTPNDNIKKQQKKKKKGRSTIKTLGIGADQCTFLKKLFYVTQEEYVTEPEFERKITGDAVRMLDNLREMLLNTIIKRIQDNVSHKKKNTQKTLNAKVAYQAIRVVLPQDVQLKVTDAAIQCIVKYRSSRTEKSEEGEEQEQDEGKEEEEEGDGARTNFGINASTGLVLRATRLSQKLKERCSFKRLSPDASIIITAAIEFILKKVIVMTLLYMLDEHTSIIGGQGEVRQTMVTPSDIRRAIEKYDKNKDPVLSSKTKLDEKDLPDTFGGEGISHMFSNVIWTQTKGSVAVTSL